MTKASTDYGVDGIINFNKMWRLLNNKGLNQQWLIDNGVHRGTIYKLKDNKNVSCKSITLLCRLLNCQPGDIMEYNAPD